MCLIGFAIGVSNRWPLVIASNRDEYLNRPTLPLTCWKSESGHEIISGRDGRAGGTWLGMTPNGRVAFLTNVREAQPQIAPLSRGELVTRWLEGTDDVASFLADLSPTSSYYGGFNLVIGDFQRNLWMWLTNRFVSTSSSLHSQWLRPGIYGLSNAALDTPWPKTKELKRVLSTAFSDEIEDLTSEALQVFLWEALANRDRMPLESVLIDGVDAIPLTVQEALSSAFVEFPENAYGTRSSTLVLVNVKNTTDSKRIWKVQMEERTYSSEYREATFKSFLERSRDYSSIVRTFCVLTF